MYRPEDPQNGRLVIYAGTALSCIAYLLLRIICAVHVQTYICQEKVLTPMGHFSKNASATLNRPCRKELYLGMLRC